MGIKSTHLITRHQAMLAIQVKLTSLDDYRLAEVLETIVNDDFKNFHIVSEQELEENKNQYMEWDGETFFNGRPYIESYTELI